MPSTRKGGGELPTGNTKKPNKGKRQLVRWDRKFNPNFVYLYQFLLCIMELAVTSRLLRIFLAFAPFTGAIYSLHLNVIWSFIC